MAFCSKCGTQLEAEVKFCPSCGAAQEQEPVMAGAEQKTSNQQSAESGAGQQQQQQQQYQQQQYQQANQQQNRFNSTIGKINNTNDFTSEFDKNDIDQNKVMALLSYLGILVLVPIFGAPKSKFARFHANQGLVLLIADIILGIVNAILTAIIYAIFRTNSFWGYAPSPTGVFLAGLIGFIIYAVIAALSIIGIVNAVKGRAKQLPVIGNFKILK